MPNDKVRQTGGSPGMPEDNSAPESRARSDKSYDSFSAGLSQSGDNLEGPSVSSTQVDKGSQAASKEYSI